MRKMKRIEGKKMQIKEIKEFVNHIREIQKNPQIIKAAEEFYRLTTNNIKNTSS